MDGLATSGGTFECGDLVAVRENQRNGGALTAWESLLLIVNGHETKRATPGARVDRQKLEIDLHWHDLRHEGACRLLWRTRQDTNLRPSA